MAKPLFSVVVPTYNRRESLGQCLEALSVQTLSPSSFEVIIVDDGSTDGTTEHWRARTFPFHTVFLVVPNGGASKARNTGVAAANGKYIAFTEDDVLPDENWLQNALKHIENGAVDVLEGRTTDLNREKEVRRFEGSHVPSFIPCNLFVRKGVFDQVGGYDPAFYDRSAHLYFREDADLGFRMLDAGFRVAFAHDVTVAHPPQFTTVRECFRHARRYVFDPLLYKKHPARFRALIEVKKVLGLTIRRPQHYVALAYVGFLLALCLAIVWGDQQCVAPLAVLAFGCSFLFRFKYQGWRALRLHEVHWMLGFLLLPLIYLASVLKGCIRYRTWGSLI